MNREELAWAAGFFDGEGHISWTGRHSQLYVHQVARQPLLRFQRAIGFGKVSKPYANKGGGAHKHSQPISRFGITNFEHVQAAVAMLWPWLSQPKRKDAKRTLLTARLWFKSHRPTPWNERAARENR